MKSAVFLRIASVLTLLHAVLHTLGAVFGKPRPGAAAEAAGAMRSNLFIVMGWVRSYWVFYKGMGLAVSVFLTVEAIVFWQLASLAKTDAGRIRPILVTFLAGYLVLAVVSYRFFFLAPVITEILIALALGVAIVKARTDAAV